MERGSLLSRLVAALRGMLPVVRARLARLSSWARSLVVPADLAHMLDGVADCALCLLDGDGRLVCWNASAPRILGYGPAELPGLPASRLFPPPALADGLPASAFQAAGLHGRFAAEGWLVRQDGSPFWASLTLTAMTGRRGRPRRYALAIRDLTAARAQAEALVQSEARFAGTVEAALDAIVSVDANQRVVVFNPAAEALFGCPAAEAIGQSLDRFIPAEHRRHHAAKVAAFSRGQSGAGPMSRRQHVHGLRADGTLVPLETSISHLAVAGQELYTAFLRDVSERVRAETALREAHAELEARVHARTEELAALNRRLHASLEEKEVLLREVHHRVKNNLQVVTSLLRLQGRGVEDVMAAQALRESQQRVEVMALVHELLYQTDGMAWIDGATYMRRLVNQLTRAYGVQGSGVSCEVVVDPVYLPLDLAVPCGLIVSELLSNSFKYAFPENRLGRVGVELRSASPTTLMLKVWDTGVGLGHEAAPRRRSLGTRLVEGLARQLRGTLSVDGRDGTMVQVVFPLGYDRRDEGVLGLVGS